MHERAKYISEMLRNVNAPFVILTRQLIEIILYASGIYATLGDLVRF